MRYRTLERPDDLFQRTLGQLASGLTADLIAETELQKFEVSQSVSIVRDVMRKHDFSQAPATRAGEVVGVVDINRKFTGETVEGWMTPLSVSTVISSHTSLREVIRLLAQSENRYRLLIGTNGIAGMVTRSDLDKLPVRLLLFSYVTHLESVLAEVIGKRASGDDWLELLDEWDSSLGELATGQGSSAVGTKAINALRGQQAKYASDDIVPSLIEVTTFPQKWIVVCKLLNLGEPFATDMARVQKDLRNKVAHTKSLVASDVHLQDLNGLLSLCDHWIEDLTRLGDLNTQGTQNDNDSLISSRIG